MIMNPSSNDHAILQQRVDADEDPDRSDCSSESNSSTGVNDGEGGNIAHAGRGHAPAATSETTQDEGAMGEMLYLGNIAAACDAVNAACKRPFRTEEQKKEERRVANRRSAKMSRDRKKLEREQLQEKATRLAQVNQALVKENEELRKQIAILVSDQQAGPHARAGPSSVGAATAAAKQSALKRMQSPPGLSAASILAENPNAHHMMGSQATGGAGVLNQDDIFALQLIHQEQQKKRNAAALMSASSIGLQDRLLPPNALGQGTSYSVLGRHPSLQLSTALQSASNPSTSFAGGFTGGGGGGGPTAAAFGGRAPPPPGHPLQGNNDHAGLDESRLDRNKRQKRGSAGPGDFL